MSALLSRAAVGLLRFYLRLFCLFAPNYRAALREHSLIEWSIREEVDEAISRGASQLGAAGVAVRHHIAELEPVGLAGKTFTDARLQIANGRGDASFVPRLAVLVLLLASTAFVLLPSPVSPVAGWSQPNSVTGSSRPAEVEPADDLREALYRSAGVCIAPGIEGPDLTEEVVLNGSPGADCSDLDR